MVKIKQNKVLAEKQRRESFTEIFCAFKETAFEKLIETTAIEF